MPVVTYLFLALGLAALAYQLLALAALAWFMRTSLPSSFSPKGPGVTLLKPVRGVDADTHGCLTSFLRQNYGGPLQVLFGVANPQDPVVPLLKDLQASHPQADIDIIICGQTLGLNPKISTLRQLEPQARYDYLIISDSDIKVGADYLQQVVGALNQPEVGLVTCPYRAGPVRSWGAALEALSISADFIPSVAMAYYVEGINFGLGATLALSRQVLAEIGGLAPLADYLADDYQLGHRVAQLGYRVHLLPYVVETHTSKQSWRGYLAHQLRWARTYRVCRPKGYFAYGITHALVFALLTWLASGMALWATGLLISTLIVRLFLAYGSEHLFLHGRLPWPYLALLPLKDLLSFGLWMLSFLGDRVNWQGEFYRVTPSGQLVRITQP
ncbi:MAG: bacteriohopanetetrol glucosamine biosynthesis glycosyltransferase HpnI [Desulfobacteraceae bacterium]